MNPINKRPIYFMVALDCEAKALIQHYRLKRLMTESVFAIYQNQSITLTLSGIGKTAMAAAVAYTAAKFGCANGPFWLNIGIAGHQDLEIGKACLVHKITDAERARSWYPPIIIEAPCSTQALVTCSSPERHYASDALYDMEASGFYEIASRFSNSEFIQCLKIVSDNRARPADSLRPDDIAGMIKDQIGMLDLVIERMDRLPILSGESTLAGLDGFTDTWHFSEQQRRQLNDLLQRWALLDPERFPDPVQFVGAKSASQVLASLKDKVDGLPLVFG